MPDKQEKAIRIVWGSEENTEVVYANQILVSHAGDTEFNLVFGLLTPPLTIGFSESELPDQLKIKPVAHIVTSPDVMKAFIRVLVDNLENFEKSKTKKETNDVDDTVR
jgi:hypothetical protein